MIEGILNFRASLVAPNPYSSIIAPMSTNRIGDMVSVSGKYTCKSCGNTLEFERGEEFPECDVCFSEDQGEWELVATEPLGSEGGVEA